MRSYLRDLLPKTVLIFVACQAPRSEVADTGRSAGPKQRDHRSDGLSRARLSSKTTAPHGAIARFNQKMYSRVAFGSPLLTSREYSNNLTHAKITPQGNVRTFSPPSRYEG